MPVKFSKKGVFRAPIVIDGLSVTLEISDPAHRKQVSANLVALSKGERIAGKASRKWYSLSYLFYATKVMEARHLLIQARPYAPNTPFLRLEYNPANTDLEEIRAIIDLILPGGWQQFVADGVCTRIDLAVDVHGVRISDLLIFWPGMRRSRQFFASGDVSFMQTDELQTYDIGAYGGKRYLCAYDRIACIRKANQKLVHKLTVAEHAVTRIEIRLNPMKNWKNVALIANPFEEVTITDYSAFSPSEDFKFSLFLRVCQVDGAQSALQRLPDHIRKAYRKRIETATCAWWDATAIWAGFPKALAAVLSISSAIDCSD